CGGDGAARRDRGGARTLERGPGSGGAGTLANAGCAGRAGARGGEARPRRLRGAEQERQGEASEKTDTRLRTVGQADCARIAGLDADPVERAAAFADVCRLNALYMIERAGSGHPGTPFSSIDVVAWLHLEVLGDGDRYFSSKGHDVPGLYAVLTA